MNENRFSKAEIIKAFGCKGVSPVSTLNLLEDHILFSIDDLRSLAKCYYVESDGLREYIFDLNSLQWLIENEHSQFTIVEHEEWEDLVYQRVKANDR